MKNSIIALIAVVVVGFALYYFVYKNNSNITPVNTYTTTSTQTAPVVTVPPTTQPAPTNPTVNPSAVSAPASVSVNIKNFAFAPGTLTIKAGTKVTWTNEDSAPHIVTSDSGSVLNSSSLSTGQSFSFTFNNVGSYAYHCSIHPSMKGIVVVTN